MTFKEFIEEVKEYEKRPDNMTFFYITHTRDYFFSLMDIERCKREKYITPTTKFEIKDDKCYVKCRNGKSIIKLDNFIKRSYPMDKEIILCFKDDKCEEREFELNTYGYSRKDENCWHYELYE